MAILAAIERFWSKVRIGTPDTCWPWTASKGRDGYGNIKIEGKSKLAHRVAWELIHGPITEGMDVLHSCDNPPCCNPFHLFLGTQADNNADCLAKGRWNPPNQAGELNHRAKTTQTQVGEIRQKYSSNLYTQQMLADEYGLSQRTVSKMVRGETWLS